MEPISRELSEELRTRHVAFLKARLRSERTREEWRQAVAGGIAELLMKPVGELVDERALAAVFSAALGDDALEKALRPIAKALLVAGEAALDEDERPLGVYVPEATRKRIEALLEQPGLVPDKLLREILTSDALEAVMQGVLYDALKEFSEKVNPFFADWGLPSLIKKFVPFGFGGVGKGLESVRTEFDRRLEPEIRKFLQGFARRALETTLALSLAKADTEPFIALRKKLFAWALSQRARELVPRGKEELAAQTREIALDIQAQVIAESRERVLAEVSEAIGSRAKRTVLEVMLELGVTHVPDAGALADASYPMLSAALATRTADTWLEALVAEFYDSVTAPARAPHAEPVGA